MFTVVNIKYCIKKLKHFTEFQVYIELKYKLKVVHQAGGDKWI